MFNPREKIRGDYFCCRQNKRHGFFNVRVKILSSAWKGAFNMVVNILPCDDHTNDYPREILGKAMDEFREYCETILTEIHATGRLLAEARLYGNLIQLFDKYNLKTRGISIALKTGYYESEISIHDYLGRELAMLHFGQGKLN
jgi:hypothetical protein